jgi:hypothetical protein
MYDKKLLVHQHFSSFFLSLLSKASGNNGRKQNDVCSMYIYVKAVPDECWEILLVGILYS